jgi:hypothetical protein
VPHEDAVLFDMLLDIAADEFEPQQSEMSDGPDIQLEIWHVLEKMQQDTEAASAVAPSKSHRV